MKEVKETRELVLKYIARVKELREECYTYRTIREILYRELGLKRNSNAMKKMVDGTYTLKKMYDDEKEKIADFAMKSRKKDVAWAEIVEKVKEDFNVSLSENTIQRLAGEKGITQEELEEKIKELRAKGKTYGEIKEILQSQYGRTVLIGTIKAVLDEDEENFKKDVTSLKDKKLEEASYKMGVANYWFNKAVPGATLITKEHDKLEVLSKHTHFVLCTNYFEKVCVPKNDILKVEVTK